LYNAAAQQLARLRTITAAHEELQHATLGRGMQVVQSVAVPSMMLINIMFGFLSCGPTNIGAELDAGGSKIKWHHFGCGPVPVRAASGCPALALDAPKYLSAGMLN
jgi:hypothetical protein